MANDFNVRVRISALDRLSAVIDKVKGKLPELGSKVRQAAATFDKLSKSTSDFSKASEKVGKSMQSIGKGLTVAFTLPAIAASGYAIKAFADYETALVGVGKTSDIQGAALEAMGQQFIKLSKEIPLSAVELMGLGQTAAQLGVTGEENILKFSATLAKLATATNIVGEEGATDLARFMKITGTDLANVDRIGSALVALGNTSAATESEILSFSTRLAGATALFGFSAPQVLGYATAMKSLGIEAEAGSSSVQRALGNINDAISKGGQKAAILAKVTGIPLDQLNKKFKDNAAGVLRDFAVGLDKVAQRGGDVTQALAYFGMDGVRDIAVIGTLSKKVGELDRAMGTASTGIEENTALNQEFNTALKTLNSQFQLVKNKTEALFISLGKRLAPAATMALKAFEGFIDFLDNNPTLATVLAVLFAILAVIGPIVLAVGTMIVTFVSFTTAMVVVNGVLAVFGLTLKGILIAVAIATAKFIIIGAIIIALVYGVYRLGKYLWDLVGGWKGITEWAGKAWDKMAGAYESVKKFLGLSGSEVDVNANTNLAPGGRSLMPQGAPVGGNEMKSQMNPEFSTQTNNARVRIDVRAPESAKVRSEASGDFLELNRGLVGVF